MQQQKQSNDVSDNFYFCITAKAKMEFFNIEIENILYGISNKVSASVIFSINAKNVQCICSVNEPKNVFDLKKKDTRTSTKKHPNGKNILFSR